MKAGERYGRLEVIQELPPYRSPCGASNRLVLCKCSCGEQRTVHLTALRRGLTQSCGCLRNDRIRETVSTHGASCGVAAGGKVLPEYSAWRSMHSRCKVGGACSKDYGDRGIAVCDRWYDFTNFLSDMGPKPSSEHSLDRIDVNGGYSPENCRWATKQEQARNKRSTLMAELDGVIKPVAEWCEDLAVPYSLVQQRIWSGWSAEKALTTPKRR